MNFFMLDRYQFDLNLTHEHTNNFWIKIHRKSVIHVGFYTDLQIFTSYQKVAIKIWNCVASEKHFKFGMIVKIPSIPHTYCS